GLNLVLAQFAGNRERGVDLQTHRQRTHVAVIDRAASRSNLNRALLLALSPRQIVAMSKKLEVYQPSEDCSRPEQANASDNRESPRHLTPTCNAIGGILGNILHKPAQLPAAPSKTENVSRGWRGRCSTAAACASGCAIRSHVANRRDFSPGRLVVLMHLGRQH